MGGWLHVRHVILIFCLHKGVVARLYVTCNYPYQCNGFGYHAIHDLKKIQITVEARHFMSMHLRRTITLLGIAIKYSQTLFIAG